MSLSEKRIATKRKRAADWAEATRYYAAKAAAQRPRDTVLSQQQAYAQRAREGVAERANTAYANRLKKARAAKGNRRR